MSPAKQKSSEKHAGKGRKASSRQASASGGTSASAYNPVSLTFHTLESVTSDSGTSNHNGRFRSIDEIDNTAGPNGASAEYDSVSNNGSCSGESEDQSHANGSEKHGAARLGTPPGLVGGLDKRDKIRWKNEKKHQRQKERRAKELKDRCTGYLMSRKLEALAQQLVAMGFSSERATMALILNEGHVEQSVAWLLEGGEGQVKEDWNTCGNLKIDISEELARIADMEIKYKYTRSEVERAIVSCEGDLDKALEWLRSHRPSDSPCRIEEPFTDVKDFIGHPMEQPSLSAPATSHISGAVQTKSRGQFEGTPPKREINSLKGKLQTSLPGLPHTLSEGNGRGVQPARSPSRTGKDWQTSLLHSDRGSNHVKKPSSVRAQTSSTLYRASIHHTSDRAESGFSRQSSVIEAKAGHVRPREPVILMKPPQSPCTSSAPTALMNMFSVSTSPMFSSSSWNDTYTSGSSLSSILPGNATCSDLASKKGGTPSKIPENLCNPILSIQLDPVAASWTPSGNKSVAVDALASPSRLLNVPSHSRGSSLSSSGLYTGLGSAFSSSSVDWSMGTIANCDYKSIDWSMAASPSSPAEAVGLWGLSSNFTSLRLSESAKPELSIGKEGPFQAVPGNSSLVTGSNSAYDVWIGSNLKATPSALGLQDKSRDDSGNTSALAHHEWTSPFAGKDLFILPHQVVPSPSL